MRLGRVLCGLAVLTLAQSGYSQAPPDNATSAQGAASLGEEQQRQMAEYLKQRLPPPKEPSLPAPPPDPRNLEGTWIADQLTQLRLERDMYDQPLPLKPDARRVLDRRLKANYVDHRPYANAAASCRPAGQTWQLGLIFPFQIFQTKDAIAFVFSEMHTIWSLRLNQPHRDARQYMGDSVGHWDGNTLVIDTTNYKQPLWIDADGTPASMHLHATFRIRRIDYGQPKLEIVTTVDDPQMFSAPWSIVRTYVWRPDFAQFEQYDCEGQVSAPDALNQYSYQPEPSEAP
jgi:hypothetical protein